MIERAFACVCERERGRACDCTWRVKRSTLLLGWLLVAGAYRQPLPYRWTY